MRGLVGRGVGRSRTAPTFGVMGYLGDGRVGYPHLQGAEDAGGTGRLDTRTYRGSRLRGDGRVGYPPLQGAEVAGGEVPACAGTTGLPHFWIKIS